MVMEMEQENYYQMRRINLHNAIEFIIQYKLENNQKIDRKWLESQKPNVIYAIEFQIRESLRKKAEKQEEEKLQVTIEEMMQSDNETELLNPDNYEEILVFNDIEDYYDEFGRLLSDVERMKVREQRNNESRRR